MREQRLIMKEVCPKSYKRSKVEAVPGPHISVLLCYLFLPFFLSLLTTHTLTQGNRWAGERMLVGRIDMWSIIKHEQPRKVGQRKDRALASAWILQLPTDGRRWTSGTWGCFPGWVLLPRLWITVVCLPPVVSSALGPSVALPVCPHELRYIIYETLVKDCRATDPTLGSAEGLSFLICQGEQWLACWYTGLYMTAQLLGFQSAFIWA